MPINFWNEQNIEEEDFADFADFTDFEDWGQDPEANARNCLQNISREEILSHNDADFTFFRFASKLGFMQAEKANIEEWDQDDDDNF